MEGKIYIDGEIGSKVTLESVRNQVLALGDIDVLNVDINSGGGEVNVGYAIKDYFLQLKEEGVKVNTNVVGMCASIATVPFLAGDDRTMLSSSTLMIHNPWMQTDKPMGAKELEDAGTHLRKEEDKLAGFYSESLGVDIEKIKQLMSVETRMDLTESKSIGFVNAKVIEYKAVAMIKPSIKLNVNNMDDKKTGILNDIKASLAKLVKGEEPVMAAAIKLEDGTEVFIDSEDGEFVGKAIFMEEGGDALGDGTYKLEDGRELVVADGMVSEIVEGEPAAPEESEEVKDLKAQIENLTAAAIESANALEESNKVNAEMKASIEVINEKVNALSVENEAMASVTVGGTNSVKAAVKTPEVKKEESKAAEGFASFLGL